MAKEIRDLDVSKLSASQLLRADAQTMRRIKPISAAKFALLPKNVQTAMALLIDQAFVVWNDVEKVENFKDTELFGLLEEYKSRSFSTFPEPLKNDILEIATSKHISAANHKFLVWILEKQNYQSLPRELRNFYDKEFEGIANSELGVEVPFDKEYEKCLLLHLTQFGIANLTADQYKFVNRAFRVNIDRIDNERLANLVAFAKQIENQKDYLAAPQNVQAFVVEAFKRCMAKAETAANNRRLQHGWKTAPGQDYNECFADFNRAFAGVKKYDSTDLNEPTKKLTLDNLIAYANLQHEFLNLGDQVFVAPTFETTKQCAEQLGLEKIAEEVNGVCRYVPSAIIPREKKVVTNSNGYQVEVFVDSKREYKTSVASPLAKTFEAMLAFGVGEFAKDINYERPDSQKISEKIYHWFGKDMSNSAKIILELAASRGCASLDLYKEKLAKTLGNFVNVDELIKLHDELYESEPYDDFEDEPFENDEDELSIEERMQEIIEQLQSDELSKNKKCELQQEYMDLEDKLER